MRHLGRRAFLATAGSAMAERALGQDDRFGVKLPELVGYGGTQQAAGTLLLDHERQYLYLLLGNGRAIEYVCGVGRGGKNEIKGDYHYILHKMENPTWGEPGDPRATVGPQNPLGVRCMWLAHLEDNRQEGFAIHGTSEPHKLSWKDGSRRISGGCTRLLNKDAIDLYNRVRVGTRVLVFYKDQVAHHVRRGQAQMAGLGLKPA